jgi:hypothetical protein
MNNDPRKDSRVPVVELNDDELTKLVGGGCVNTQETTISKHFDRRA